MRRRIAVLATGCTLALTGVALAASPAGTYQGKETAATSFGSQYPIYITVTGTSISRIIYGANYSGASSCASYSGREKENFRSGAITIKHGKFKASVVVYPAPYKDVIGLSGKLTGTTLTGAFSETFTDRQHATCKAARFTFTATRT